ncbi:allantoinase AllB [Cystobacter ferrugineus]|uniref:allantoinase n=1 Tax=Cystobacter ferrugineus TaxID=83449 RepID=A0A1L9BJB5_9BACT|nr:allantoinase AllB [Cystobacter ferrugineus]OJH42258.1 allantoinase [Cystobacter ferrugineus]
MSQDWVLRGERVVTDTGVCAAAVVVRDGKVAAIVGPKDVPAGLPVTDVGQKVIMPGVVDCHAHINEPGRTEWEGFETATRAAAAGGITTVVDMPLNSIPATTSREALAQKAAAAERHCAIDYGFWGGVIPGNAGELDAMIDAGVAGFKCFLIHSGVDEFPHVTREDLERAMPLLARRGVPLIVHAELTASEEPPKGDTRTYQSYLASRPRKWEDDAIHMMVELCRKHRGPVHIVHLSSSDALGEIASAKKEGLPFTVETCPHYLTFDAEHIPDGATWFKCAPPIRESENREKLWAGLARGDIDMVVSDHSPCTPALKHLEHGDFGRAWGGIASLQFSLPAVWTGMRERGHGLEQLVRWMCHAPARLTGLTGVKGSLTPGADADLLVFDPEASFTPDASGVLHRHKLTPYAGRALVGVVEHTWVRGQKVHTRGEPPPAPTGRWIRRPSTARRVD